MGAAAGPASFGLLAAEVGYPSAWAAISGVGLLAALVIGLAARLPGGSASVVRPVPRTK